MTLRVDKPSTDSTTHQLSNSSAAADKRGLAGKVRTPGPSGIPGSVCAGHEEGWEGGAKKQSSMSPNGSSNTKQYRGEKDHPQLSSGYSLPDTHRKWPPHAPRGHRQDHPCAARNSHEGCHFLTFLNTCPGGPWLYGDKGRVGTSPGSPPRASGKAPHRRPWKLAQLPGWRGCCLFWREKPSRAVPSPQPPPGRKFQS